MANKCKHNRDKDFCCKCRYGEDKDFFKSETEVDQIADVTEFLNLPITTKLNSFKD